MSTSEDQWYFDLSTGDVSQGKQGSWDNRMGPYASEAEARDALKVARERNQAADAAEEDEEDWGVAPSWEGKK
ncbi:hypothetical protein [Corynebacterium halotolerans]|uniref:hypothetical protein n=1 Tax=Corynebacterium halotolerans TaxID=225326 RepID=UPI003CF2C285